MVKKQSIRSDLLRELLCKNGSCILRVTGTCMVPVLYPGAEVTIEDFQFAQVQAGMIIVYSKGFDCCIHRVFSVDGEQCSCRGDRSNHKPDFVTLESYVGRATQMKNPSMIARIYERVKVYGRLRIYKELRN